jgi:hypothetical protein
MKMRKIWWLWGAPLLLATGITSALAITVKHEPNFHRQSQVPPGNGRKEKSDEFVRSFGQMIASIRQPDWRCLATEDQINSFFAEGLVRLGEADNLSRLGISSPSVTLEDDQVRLAFRYGRGWFSTILSYDLRIWLIPKESNLIAVQILRARAGALPVPAQTILHHLSEFAARQNYKMTLYRYEGTPVAIIRLQEDPNPTSTLTVLKFSAKGMDVRGTTSELALPPLNLKPAPDLH